MVKRDREYLAETVATGAISKNFLHKKNKFNDSGFQNNYQIEKYREGRNVNTSELHFSGYTATLSGEPSGTTIGEKQIQYDRMHPPLQRYWKYETVMNDILPSIDQGRDPRDTGYLPSYATQFVHPFVNNEEDVTQLINNIASGSTELSEVLGNPYQVINYIQGITSTRLEQEDNRRKFELADEYKQRTADMLQEAYAEKNLLLTDSHQQDPSDLQHTPRMVYVDPPLNLRAIKMLSPERLMREGKMAPMNFNGITTRNAFYPGALGQMSQIMAGSPYTPQKGAPPKAPSKLQTPILSGSNSPVYSPTTAGNMLQHAFQRTTFIKKKRRNDLFGFNNDGSFTPNTAAFFLSGFYTPQIDTKTNTVTGVKTPTKNVYGVQSLPHGRQVKKGLALMQQKQQSPKKP